MYEKSSGMKLREQGPRLAAEQRGHSEQDGEAEAEAGGVLQVGGL